MTSSVLVADMKSNLAVSLISTPTTDKEMPLNKGQVRLVEA